MQAVTLFRFPARRMIPGLAAGAAVAAIATTEPAAGLLADLATRLAAAFAAVDGGFLLTGYAALFAIVNPLVAIPFFATLTQESDRAERRGLAGVVAATFLITLAIAALIGEGFLAVFALDVGAFRAAGGIILLLLALSLINGQETAFDRIFKSEDARANLKSVAIFPLAIPLLSGPGAIATVIIQCDGVEGAGGYLAVAAIIAAMTATLFLVLCLAPVLARRLGVTGMNVINRISGMIVAAIAMDTLARGIAAMFPGLASPGLL